VCHQILLSRFAARGERRNARRDDAIFALLVGSIASSGWFLRVLASEALSDMIEAHLDIELLRRAGGGIFPAIV